MYEEYCEWMNQLVEVVVHCVGEYPEVLDMMPRCEAHVLQSHESESVWYQVL